VRTLLLSLAVLLLAATPVRLLAGSGGSAYSIIGVGDLRMNSGVRSAGMGYTGIGVASSSYINGLAPATWALIDRTRLEAGMLYEGFNSTDGQRSRYLARADFNGALLALPISPAHGITFVGGFTPYSTVNYDTYTKGSYRSGGDTLEYALQHVGTGGLGKGIMGLSYAPLPELAFGFSLNYLFGSIERSVSQVPTDDSHSGGLTTYRLTANGINFTVGGLYSGFGAITPSLSSLSLGFFVSSRGVLSTEQKTLYTYSTLLDTSGERTSNMAVPLSYGIGLAYQAGERVLLAADYVSERWSTAEIDGATPAGTGNATRVGIGLERLPKRESGASFFQRLPLRVGASYHWTYYRAAGERINEWAVTAGTAFPLAGDTRLSIAGEYAIRGGLQTGLVRDRIFRLTASFSISETWFIPFEEE
jgi:hypothetical protein